MIVRVAFQSGRSKKSDATGAASNSWMSCFVVVIEVRSAISSFRTTCKRTLVFSFKFWLSSAFYFDVKFPFLLWCGSEVMVVMGMRPNLLVQYNCL